MRKSALMHSRMLVTYFGHHRYGQLILWRCAMYVWLAICWIYTNNVVSQLRVIVVCLCCMITSWYILFSINILLALFGRLNLNITVYLPSWCVCSTCLVCELLLSVGLNWCFSAEIVDRISKADEDTLVGERNCVGRDLSRCCKFLRGATVSSHFRVVRYHGSADMKRSVWVVWSGGGLASVQYVFSIFPRTILISFMAVSCTSTPPLLDGPTMPHVLWNPYFPFPIWKSSTFMVICRCCGCTIWSLLVRHWRPSWTLVLSSNQSSLPTTSSILHPSWSWRNCA